MQNYHIFKTEITMALFRRMIYNGVRKHRSDLTRPHPPTEEGCNYNVIAFLSSFYKEHSTGLAVLALICRAIESNLLTRKYT